MTNLQKLVIAFAIFGSIGIISSVHGVDPQDYDEAQKEDEPLNKESVTEYPNGVNVIPGQADIHYPIYSKIPKSAFSCSGRRPGFYADTDLRCQVWHICDESGVQQSFLCTNGTIYSQDKRVCDWWYNVNCDPEEVNRNYEQNSELYKGPPPKNNNNNNDDFEDNDLPPPPPTRKSTPPPPPPQRQHYEQQQQNHRRPAQNDERQQREEREQAPSQSQQSRQRNSNERPQSPPPQQQNHQQQQRPHGNPPPPGTPEKKRVIVLRLPGPLPPGATIPPHVLMQYAESVLAAERAGKPPPTGLAQSASQNSVSNYNVHRQPAPRSQEASSPRPQQQQQQKQQQQQQTETPAPRQVSQEPAQARPAQQPPARPTPRGPIVPYTPRPFSQFLEDAVRFNGQTKTSPPQQQQQQKQNSRPAQAEQNYRPPQPVQTSPRPSQERKPTPSYNEPRPQAQNTNPPQQRQNKNYEEQRQPQNNRQNNNYQQEQRQQAQNPPQQERTQQNYNVEGRQTSPPQQQQNRQNYEEQRRNDNQNQNNRRNQPETPERQNQNHEEQRRQNAQQIITNYERQQQQQKQSENEYRQQQSEEQYSKSKAPPQTPIPHKKSPPKPKFAAPPADSHKKFRHSTPRKHGEVKFAPKSASALEDQDFEVPEESRRPAYPFQFNNFQPVPHLSAEAEKQTPRPRPIKENHHVKTVQEKPRVKYQEPIQVQQKPTEEYRPVTPPAVQIQPKTTEEEPIVRRLVVVARQGLKIKDPRAGADRSTSSEQIEQFQKSRYESVKVNSDVPTTSTTTTTEVPTTLASEIIPAETTRSPTRRLIKKKILRSTTLPPTFGTTSAEEIVIPDVYTRKVTRAPYESKKVQQKFYDAEDDVHVPYETTRAPQTPTIVVRKQQIEKATYAPQPQVEHVTKATQDLGFDVYGRNPEEDEEEELLKAAQELQANENYGKRKRPSA